MKKMRKIIFFFWFIIDKNYQIMCLVLFIDSQVAVVILQNFLDMLNNCDFISSK